MARCAASLRRRFPPRSTLGCALRSRGRPTRRAPPRRRRWLVPAALGDGCCRRRDWCSCRGRPRPSRPRRRVALTAPRIEALRAEAEVVAAGRVHGRDRIADRRQRSAVGSRTRRLRAAAPPPQREIAASDEDVALAMALRAFPRSTPRAISRWWSNSTCSRRSARSTTRRDRADGARRAHCCCCCSPLRRSVRAARPTRSTRRWSSRRRSAPSRSRIRRARAARDASARPTARCRPHAAKPARWQREAKRKAFLRSRPLSGRRRSTRGRERLASMRSDRSSSRTRGAARALVALSSQERGARARRSRSCAMSLEERSALRARSRAFPRRRRPRASHANLARWERCPRPSAIDSARAGAASRQLPAAEQERLARTRHDAGASPRREPGRARRAAAVSSWADGTDDLRALSLDAPLRGPPGDRAMIVAIDHMQLAMPPGERSARARFLLGRPRFRRGRRSRRNSRGAVAAGSRRRRCACTSASSRASSRRARRIPRSG